MLNVTGSLFKCAPKRTQKLIYHHQQHHKTAAHARVSHQRDVLKRKQHPNRIYKTGVLTTWGAKAASSLRYSSVELVTTVGEDVGMQDSKCFAD
eukprot:4851589-Amphidinium_carterae.1